MTKIKVLFVCIHNSARSQMAEAFLKKYGEDMFEVESAGFEPGTLNPVVIDAMADAGIDISKNSCDGVFDFYKAGKRYAYVITVCDESSAERCPIFPGLNKRIHWSFHDPSVFSGDHAERLAKTKIIRDQIEKKVIEFVKEIKEEFNKS